MTQLLSVSKLSKRNTPEGSPLSIEKDIVLIQKNEDSKELYGKFTSDLSIYLSKIKNQSSSICNLLLNKDVIYLGMLGKANPNVLATYTVNNNKITAIVLNCSNIDIDLKTGEISDPEGINYILYFTFIRATCFIFSKDIEKDSSLNDLLIEYLTYLLMKNLKLPMLSDKQIELLKFIIGVMFYKHFYHDNDTLAIEKCETVISKEFYNEFKPTIKQSNISKYSAFKDVIKLINEFRISFDPPNQLLYSLLLNIKTLGVLLITSDIENLIATAILSQYPCDYYAPLFINRQYQSKIESIISQYFSKVNFQKL